MESTQLKENILGTVKKGTLQDGPVLASSSPGQLKQKKQVLGGEGLVYKGNFQKVTYSHQTFCEVDIKPNWEETAHQEGVSAFEVKSAEPHPEKAHPNLSPHWAKETLWSLPS